MRFELLKFQPLNGDSKSVSTSDDRHELTAIEKGADTLWPSCVPLGHQMSSRTFYFCRAPLEKIQTTSSCADAIRCVFALQSKADLTIGSPWKPPNRKALNYSQIPIKQGFTPILPFSHPPSPSSPSPTHSAQFTWIPSKEKKVFSNTQETTTRKENPTSMPAR